MSIYITNKSTCSVCGKVILKSDHKGFPPFIANTYDPLYIFHDANCHKECVQSHSLYPILVRRLNDINNLPRPIDRPCAHCGETTKHPDDSFAMPYISYGSKDLEKFDYLWIHRHCIPEYVNIKELYDALQKIDNSGLWGGDVIKHCISEIEKYINV